MIVDLLYLVNREWAFLGSLRLNLLPLQGPQVQFENPIWVALFKVNVVVLAELTVASENVISISNQGPASISTYISSNVLTTLISGLFKKAHRILPSSSYSLWRVVSMSSDTSPTFARWVIDKKLVWWKKVIGISWDSVWQSRSLKKQRKLRVRY